jgi:HAT1-interacting factor 1
LKNEILPFSSRQIAEGHLKLALVLDITSGRLADAINHVELSIQSVEERLSELRLGSQSQPSPEAADPSSPKKDIKGKGKARKLVRDPAVTSMSAAQIEDEVKDLEGMKAELQMKVRASRPIQLCSNF